MSATIAEAIGRLHNAFSALRLVLALAVVVSHAFSVASGDPAAEPLARATGFALGEHAVNGFFAVSGFLVTMSMDRRGARDYVIARSLRILPGLVAATLLVSLVLGAALTRLPLAEYYGSPELRRFITGTLTAFKSNAALPGLFEANPYRSPLGTVWTLKYESLCYLAVLLSGVLGILRWRWLSLVLVGGLAAALVAVEFAHPDLPKGIETVLRLPMIFATGAALYLWRDRVRLSPWWLLALPAALLLQGTPLYRSALFLAEAYAAVGIALLPALARPSLDPPADLSYGVYLYGWPIQQVLHALWPQGSGWVLLGPSIVLALCVAAVSWYAIEKPALGLKARALGRRTLGTIEPAGP
ncbi:acyltransferase family protein [Methylobacterium haplocladii]|uniref:Acyltransferase n=1 Tax=Methylobacterium haplocladii TaxID=1176176 RepID=A0A512IP36_9HYPH|nr:acyltransferase [Methylobacterium haplocladii]GEO99463.1 acyltransferase [Methylobacterium haplocladii]GJD83292.1 hypothetical protein HPGCJGGD_1158 [Methylobacterium haplocladii]GLS58940.1 acyltransferase [Methylobacterium haplocladii]